MDKRSLLISVAVLMTIVGCGGKPGLTGNWTYEKIPSGIDFTMVFNSDGTWTQTISDGKTQDVLSGTYSLQDSKLTMKQTKGFKGDASTSEWSHNIKWTSSDKFEFTDTKPPTVYVRKK